MIIGHSRQFNILFAKCVFWTLIRIFSTRYLFKGLLFLNIAKCWQLLLLKRFVFERKTNLTNWLVRNDNTCTYSTNWMKNTINHYNNHLKDIENGMVKSKYFFFRTRTAVVFQRAASQKNYFLTIHDYCPVILQWFINNPIFLRRLSISIANNWSNSQKFENKTLLVYLRRLDDLQITHQICFNFLIWFFGP